MTECSHPLDPEYVHAADVTTVAVESGDDGIRFRLALPCPECSTPLELTATLDGVSEGDFDLPLDDARYD